MEQIFSKLTRAQESRIAIEKIYVSMRHLFFRGEYKPLGMSGESLRNSLVTLNPEIYGSIGNKEQLELNGLLYVLERLPKGIEECRIIKLISKEGLENSGFEAIVPPKRVRNCYRVDDEQMYIEMTRGRSDIYDILTHLTFLYNEAEKIRYNGLDIKNRLKRDWTMLEEIVGKESKGKKFDKEKANAYVSTLIGRTYEETAETAEKFENKKTVNSFYHVIYWLGKLSIDEYINKNDREILFSAMLRDRVGHHIYGEIWASNIKRELYRKKLIERPIHVISANPHSILNCLFAYQALKKDFGDLELEEFAKELSTDKSGKYRNKVKKLASKQGMQSIEDQSGTNLKVQIFELDKIDWENVHPALSFNYEKIKKEKPILIVMDYAFGEQAYETMDELLKPFENKGVKVPLNIHSVSIMGKAGILEGKKGEIMIPTSHVFEGTADNYPFKNQFTTKDFNGNGIAVFEGPMITVLGTSLQNRDILRYFLKSSWKAIGLEMEGAHYQKAIQSASAIRKSVDSNLKIRYAYYASDNPLETGSTLASGSLGVEGVKPTYLISVKILNQILEGDVINTSNT